jgi:uncharacterized protein
MADAKEQHEPSMEEILASIRKIISEDGEPAPGGAVAPGAQGAEDALVLTEEVNDDGTPVEPMAAALPEMEPEPAPEPEPESPPPPLAREPQIDLVEADPEPEPELVSLEMEPEPAPMAAAPERHRLISDTTAAASLAALSELVSRTHREPDVQSMPLGNANRTLEDLTKELLRPILKAWLDENLPELVERIVREEIGRLALDAQRR